MDKEYWIEKTYCLVVMLVSMTAGYFCNGF
jgi:hypothetical protein